MPNWQLRLKLVFIPYAGEMRWPRAQVWQRGGIKPRVRTIAY